MSAESRASGATPFSVNYWGSHPDAGNDDCWTGEDFATEAEARACFEKGEIPAYAGVASTEYLELQGPDVYAVKINPLFSKKRREKQQAQDDAEWRSEYETQMRMGGLEP